LTKKIISRDGSTVQIQGDGQIWLSIGTEQRKPIAFTSPAYVKNHCANLFTIFCIEKKYDKYVPVYDVIFRHAKRFHIRQLRMMFQEVKDTHVGQRLNITYGYISSSRFSHLRKRRKSTMANERKVRLLRRSDFTFHSK
jgi:hypothetical protein